MSKQVKVDVGMVGKVNRVRFAGQHVVILEGNKNKSARK